MQHHLTIQEESLRTSHRQQQQQQHNETFNLCSYVYYVIHCGVVGNMQASHVCAPGSIPGNGTFYYNYTEE